MVLLTSWVIFGWTAIFKPTQDLNIHYCFKEVEHGISPRSSTIGWRFAIRPASRGYSESSGIIAQGTLRYWNVKDQPDRNICRFGHVSRMTDTRMPKWQGKNLTDCSCGPTCLAVGFMSFQLFLSNQASQDCHSEKKSRVNTNSRSFKITYNCQ